MLIGQCQPIRRRLVTLMVSFFFIIIMCSKAYFKMCIIAASFASTDICRCLRIRFVCLCVGLGVDIWVEDVSGESLKIRERAQVKIGHVAVGISEQVRILFNTCNR